MTRWVPWLAAALMAFGVAGCGKSAPARFYTLASTATADGKPTPGVSVAVGPVSVPASVDRPEFVVQSTPYRVEIQDFDRWASPLGDSIARTVVGDLVVLLGTPTVATAPFANFDPTYRVSINVDRFDSVLGDGIVFEAVWAVNTIQTDQTRSGRTVAREPAGGAGIEALAAAHSRAIAKLSADIAAAIRSAANRGG